MKFKISSMFLALVALCCGKIVFFRNVVLERRLHRLRRAWGSKLEGLGLQVEGLGLQVGTKLEHVGPEAAIFGLLWALLGALN